MKQLHKQINKQIINKCIVSVCNVMDRVVLDVLWFAAQHCKKKKKDAANK